jgi:ATP-dependent DNA ligase
LIGATARSTLRKRCDACKMGLEGIVSKRLGSIYRSGKCKD